MTRLLSTASLVALAPTLLASSALAVDLSVGSIEVDQAIQTGALTLVAKNATIVRVKVAVTGSAAAVPGVDAELHVFSNGVEIPGSPFFSSNGPISAPLSPNSANENDTINFLCVPPQSNDVDFYVTVNPLHTVAETDYTNNTGSVLNKAFLCRKMVELAYVPINYTPGGGLPPANMPEPGYGDAFLRGIYKTGDWNYHRSPLGSLTWTQNIEVSNNTLLTTLNDIRNVQIPAAGYSKPEFIFGWLPGNPYSGNGQAIGIPGAAAFGNTEESRFQRTFAHEIGHCWGEPHNTLTIATVGFDVLSQLKDPLNIAPVMPTSKKDIMYAGLLTNQAWVATVSFNDCINDARSQCTADQDSGGHGGANDALAGERCLRIAGEYNHTNGSIALQASQRMDIAEPTANDPAGDATVTAFDDTGAQLTSIRVKTGTCREKCNGDGILDRSPFYVMLPETINGKSIARVTIKDVKSRKMLAQQIRSAHAPTAQVTAIGKASVGQGGFMQAFDPAEPLVGDVEVRWAASDPDGDALATMLLYSPDGGNSWTPLAANLDSDPTGGENQFVFNTGNIPASQGANGLVKVRVSDGMNIVDGEFPITVMMSTGNPPDVHVISPNTGITVPQHASVVLQASAWDIDEQLLPETSVKWESNIDGLLGTGRLFVANHLTPGVHTLTLTGTDSTGLSTVRQVQVTVTARTVRSADLNGDGIVDAADLAVLLGAWGTGGSPADLDLDGTVGGGDLAILLGAWN
ncbi:MAG: hypothetical protein U0572_04365 [Phycisphaerales bacterium]